MPIIDLLQTQTFRDWFNKTNEVIDKINASVLGDGTIATGVYIINPGSLEIVNTFFANASVVNLRGNTTLTANAVVSSNCNVWNFACGTLLIQPINGTTVNSSLFVNSIATFNNQVTFSANVTFNGDVTEVGNTVINGNMTATAATFLRNLVFNQPNTIFTATLAAPQVDDYGPDGFQNCAFLVLTPTIDVTLTGMAQPTAFATGGRFLFIQNASNTFSLSLASANTSSGVNNRFKFPGDISMAIPPGAMVQVVYTSTTNQWRATSVSSSLLPSITVLGNTALNGNTSVGGWLNVAHQLIVTGNSALTGNVSVSGFINAASTLQVASNILVGGGSVFTGNAQFGGFANIAGTLQVTGNVVLGNTIINGTLQDLSALIVGGTCTVTGNGVFNGVRLYANGQLRCDTTNGRIVLPVGVNLWAT
jgi:UDP-3-O-[3-hydroxymyristoyl] glucosamine N-acyltransferase